MHNATQHASTIELEQGLAEVLASPTDTGHLTAIVVRPATNERRMLESATLTPENGIDGDRWVNDSFYSLKDGRSDPRCQVSIMNDRFLRQVAGDKDDMCLAGDNLIVDLDLSEANLPAGSQISIGPGRKILFINSRIGATTAARPKPIDPWMIEPTTTKPSAVASSMGLTGKVGT